MFYVDPAKIMITVCFKVLQDIDANALWPIREDPIYMKESIHDCRM